MNNIFNDLGTDLHSRQENPAVVFSGEGYYMDLSRLCPFTICQNGNMGKEHENNDNNGSNKKNNFYYGNTLIPKK